MRNARCRRNYYHGPGAPRNLTRPAIGRSISDKTASDQRDLLALRYNCARLWRVSMCQPVRRRRLPLPVGQ